MLKRDDILLTQEQIWGKYRVFGKSFKYNQLVQNGNFSSLSGWSGTSYNLSISNNKLIAEVNDDGSSFLSYNVPLVSNHKYILLSTLKLVKYTAGSFFIRQNNMFNNVNVLAGGVEGNTYNNATFFETNNTYSTASIQFFRNNVDRKGDIIELSNVQVIDLTLMYDSGNEPTTIEQFYATDLGKAIQSGFYPPYSAENAIYSATSPLSFYKGNTLVSTFAPSPVITLSGIGTAKDYWQNWNGKVNRAIGNVDLGTLSWYYNSPNFYAPISDAKVEFDGLISKYTFHKVGRSDILDKEWTSIGGEGKSVWLKDSSYTQDQTGADQLKSDLSGVYLHCELATPTTETINSLMLPKGITKCTDANGVELEIENI